MLEHTPDERSIVEDQLGRPVRGIWRVAAKCHLGIPMVIENHPLLEDGTPFPTTFWLTCPILNRRIARLESDGAMKRISGSVAASGELENRLLQARARYRRRRDSHHVLDAPVPGGGAERVKCLHVHVAHELSDPPSPVGSIALARAGWPDCVAPCVGPAR